MPPGYSHPGSCLHLLGHLAIVPASRDLHIPAEPYGDVVPLLWHDGVSCAPRRAPRHATPRRATPHCASQCDAGLDSLATSTINFAVYTSPPRGTTALPKSKVQGGQNPELQSPRGSKSRSPKSKGVKILKSKVQHAKMV